ncbi:hypothetical protein EJ06DRAFT_452721, partial [Trichodelitschia bisporula]
GRVRRRVGVGGEHVKFRRTRSGCYTCRNRRVKCDETRPICERCRKGNRDCLYPDPTTSKPRRGSAKAKADDLSSPSEEDDDLDMEPASATSTISNTPSLRESSDSPSVSAPLTAASSLTAPSLGSSTGKSPTPSDDSTRGDRRSSLPKDIRFFLDYAQMSLTRHHWGIRTDSNNFFSQGLVDLALKFEPLLYALVGFSAYFYTISRPEGQLKDFLGYYMKSVTLLRKSFGAQKPSIATILTILQLAMIEEYLGDWVNLMSHQKAAFQMITALYTPEQMVSNDPQRKLLQWYMHFDTFVGILAGTGPQLGREWFAANHAYYAQESEAHPDSLALMYDERYSWIRLAGHDMATLFARKAKDGIGADEFGSRRAALSDAISNWRDNLPSKLMDDSYRVHDFNGWDAPDLDDIVDPYEPGLLFGGPLFDTNLLVIDFYGLELVYKSHVGAPPAETRDLAYRMCQMFEAIELSNLGCGLVTGMQAGIALAVVFLPREPKEIMWARRKLALVEASGYSFPAMLRNRLETLWSVDLSNWWLPLDDDNVKGPRLSKAIRSIRGFAIQPPRDQKGEDLTEMRGIFDSLSLSDA